MADIKCSSQNCTVHLQVMAEIEHIKEDILELKISIKDTVDVSKLDEMYRQVEEMKARIDRLTESDIRQTEALAGIHNVLSEFKEIHKCMRDDYSKLVDSQVETQNTVCKISGMLEASTKATEPAPSGPWYSQILKSKWVQIGGLIVIVAVVVLVASHWQDVIEIAKTWAVKPN